MSPVIGVAAFLLVVAALFALNIILGRRYVRGRSRDRLAENVMRETALGDPVLGYLTGGSAPYPGPSDPSPRDQLHPGDRDQSE